MTKRLILGLTVISLMLVMGCGGGQPTDELTQSPTETTRTTDPGDNDSGDGDRPGDRGVESMDEALAALQMIYFDFDKYNLREDAKRALDANAQILQDNPGANISILGHCDERGTNEDRGNAETGGDSTGQAGNDAVTRRTGQAAAKYLKALG